MRDDRKSADFIIGVLSLLLIYAVLGLFVVTLSERTNAAPYLISLMEAVK